MNQNELLNTLKKVDEEKTTIKKQDAKQKVGSPVELMFNQPNIRAKFEKVLNENTNQFIGGILSLVKSDTYLSKCDPATILSSAMQAAILDLPINKTLGYAYIVPYKNKDKGHEAQLQIGYKGYIQLALRSGQYENMNVIPIYDGELISYNRLTEELKLNFDERKSDEVIGYAAHFKLINGFNKTVYWTKEQVKSHANQHSQSYRRGNKIWEEHFDAMACKTVLKHVLAQYGLLSVEMQQAVIKDKDVINDNNDIDNFDDDTIILNDGDFEVMDNDNLQ